MEVYGAVTSKLLLPAMRRPPHGRHVHDLPSGCICQLRKEDALFIPLPSRQKVFAVNIDGTGFRSHHTNCYLPQAMKDS
eukprot:1843393-Amphidinium_carterae.1